jgi:hypothetical protein
LFRRRFAHKDGFFAIQVVLYFAFSLYIVIVPSTSYLRKETSCSAKGNILLTCVKFMIGLAARQHLDIRATDLKRRILSLPETCIKQRTVKAGYEGLSRQGTLRIVFAQCPAVAKTEGSRK